MGYIKEAQPIKRGEMINETKKGKLSYFPYIKFNGNVTCELANGFDVLDAEGSVWKSHL